MLPPDLRLPIPSIQSQEVPPGYKKVRVISNKAPRILRKSRVIYVPAKTQIHSQNDYRDPYHALHNNKQQLFQNGLDGQFQQRVYQEQYLDLNCQENNKDGGQQQYRQEYQKGYQKGYQLEDQQGYHHQNNQASVFKFQQPTQQPDMVQEHFYNQQSPRQSLQQECVSKKRRNSGERVDRKNARIPCIESFKDFMRNFPVEMERPSFSLRTLCIFAILNSPEQYATTAEVYFFIIHHFPYYRYVTNNWKNSVRNVLSNKDDFKIHKFKSHFKCAYSIRGFLNKNKFVKRMDWIYINTIDPRGIDFYNRIFNGEVGLPRQLFYHMIGKHIPHLAGPENSALFYNLIAMKYIPSPDDTTIFREYYTEHMGTEPKHEEPYLNFNSEYKSCIENMTSYGAALKPGEEMHTPNAREIEFFHKNVEKYFWLQRYCQDQNLPNWSTPNVEIVHELFDIMAKHEGSNNTKCNEEVLKKLVTGGRRVAPARPTTVPLRSGPKRVRPPPLLSTNDNLAQSLSVPVGTTVRRKFARLNRKSSVPIQNAVAPVAHVPQIYPNAEMVPREFTVPVGEAMPPTDYRFKPMALVEPVELMTEDDPSDFVDNYDQNLLRNFKATDTLFTLNGSRSPTINSQTAIENLFNEPIYEVEQHRMHSFLPIHEFFRDFEDQSPPENKNRLGVFARLNT